jgi:hypothetical protein
MKLNRLVLEHGAERDAARQVRAVLDPFQELAGVVFEHAAFEVLLQHQPGRVSRSPILPWSGCRARRAHSRARPAGRLAIDDGLSGSRTMKSITSFWFQRGVLGIEAAMQLGHAQHRAPALLLGLRRLRQQRGNCTRTSSMRAVFSARSV